MGVLLMTDSHIFLVAIHVEGNTLAEAQGAIIDTLKPVTGYGTPIIEWWIAEDERIDNSHNESAIFIPYPLSQDEAYQILMDSLVKNRV